MSLFFLIPDNVNQTLLSFASQTVIIIIIIGRFKRGQNYFALS